MILGQLRIRARQALNAPLRKPYICLLQIFSSISLSVLFSSTNQRFSFTKYFPLFPPHPKNVYSFSFLPFSSPLFFSSTKKFFSIYFPLFTSLFFFPAPETPIFHLQTFSAFSFSVLLLLHLKIFFCQVHLV